MVGRRREGGGEGEKVGVVGVVRGGMLDGGAAVSHLPLREHLQGDHKEIRFSHYAVITMELLR